MAKIPRPTRILAIDPGIRELGFAVFEEKALLRYGVRRFRERKRRESRFMQAKRFMESLLRISNPHVLVLEKLSHPQRQKNKALANLMNHFKALATVKGVKVYELNPTKAKEQLFAEVKPTKKNTAELIASQYPELSEYVPEKKRILWTYKNHYWVNVFDACALALAYLEKKK